MGVILSYVNMIAGLVISVIYTPVMLRLLGKSEYGIYNIAASVVSYLGLLDFGFGSTYIRFFSRYSVENDKEGLKKLNGVFITLFSALGLIALVLGSVLTFNLEVFFGAKFTPLELERTKILLIILILNLAISFPLQVFNSYIGANECFVYQRILQLAKTIFNPLIAIPLLLMGYKSIGLVVATVAVNMTINILNVYYALHKLNMQITIRRGNAELVKEIATFSGFIFINMLVDEINWNVDKFLLGTFSGTTAVAVYSLAGQLNNYYKSVSTSVSSVFGPRIHRLVLNNSDRELTELFSKVGRIQFMMLSCVLLGACFWGEYFIRLWAGKSYIKSYPMLLILMFSVTIPLIQNLGIEIQRAKNMHQFRSLVYLIIAILNIAISIPLCKRYEGIGCAIGTAISLIVGNGIIMNIYYHRKMELDIIFFWKEIGKIIPALILPIVYGIIVIKCFPVTGIIRFVEQLIIFVILYFLCLWYMAMNREEKNRVRAFVAKIFRRNV